jgi:hypothetical protein
MARLRKRGRDLLAPNRAAEEAADELGLKLSRSTPFADSLTGKPFVEETPTHRYSQLVFVQAASFGNISFTS